jgi:hypothetical protein
MTFYCNFLHNFSAKSAANGRWKLICILGGGGKNGSREGHKCAFFVQMGGRHLQIIFFAKYLAKRRKNYLSGAQVPCRQGNAAAALR